MASSYPAERIDLPSGATLWYVDDGHPSEQMRHSYWRHNEKTGKRGTRLTGVTTAVKTLDYDPDRLLTWAAKTQCIGIAELVGPVLLGEVGVEELAWLASHESIWRELESAELTFEDVRNRAATKGTNVHRYTLEALAKGRAVPDFEQMTDEEIGYSRGVVAFWLDHEPEPEQVEQIVYSVRLGVAGRLDFRGRIARCEDEHCACHAIDTAAIGVLDLKTGNYLSAAAHAQVGGGYPRLAGESGFGESEWALILKVRADGSYELVEAEGTPEGFEAAVAAYREAGRISREAEKKRKARLERSKARDAVAA